MTWKEALFQGFVFGTIATVTMFWRKRVETKAEIMREAVQYWVFIVTVQTLAIFYSKRYVAPHLETWINRLLS